jgi:2-phospho-L-lactate guanylyltransferase
VTYVVIPAKDFHGAKRRLAGLLQPHERSALARATLTDTLTACVQAKGLSGIGVVTCDRAVAELAEGLRAEVLWEAEARGQSEAVAKGGRECLRRGIPSMLTLPGDLPLLTTADVEELAAAAQSAPPVLLVPNREDTGTNALALTPPDCLPVAFGDDSFRRHLRLCAERDLAVAVRRMPRVALDIDTPDDLAVFVARPVPSHSLQALTDLGVLERFAAAPFPVASDPS